LSIRWYCQLFYTSSRLRHIFMDTDIGWNTWFHFVSFRFWYSIPFIGAVTERIQRAHQQKNAPMMLLFPGKFILTLNLIFSISMSCFGYWFKGYLPEYIHGIYDFYFFHRTIDTSSSCYHLLLSYCDSLAGFAIQSW